MNEKISRNKIFSGLMWKFAERILAQGVSLIVSIVLARILLPEDYGTVSMVMVFITIANVFVSNGFSTALIQNKDCTDSDYSTMFYCSVVVSIVVYFIIFLLSPLVENFYGLTNLGLVLRVLAIKLPISAVNSIQHAYVSRNMLFKRFFWSTLIGTLVSGIVGIIMAIQGFGVWALVTQYLVNSIMDTVVLFFTTEWKPKLLFSLNAAKKLMNYGWRITIAELISTVYSQLRSLVIGKKYSSSDLAYYNKGDSFPALLANNINSSISTVLFPALANVQSNPYVIKKMTRQSIKVCAYTIFPLMCGLAAVANNFVSVVLTDKWLPCVPFLRMSCINYALMAIGTANLQALKGMGRSDIYLKMEVIKKTVGIILLLISMNFGVIAIAVGGVIVTIICELVNIYPNVECLSYGYKEQLFDLLPATFCSAVMWLVVWGVGELISDPLITLSVQIPIGFLVYLMCSVIFNRKTSAYMFDIIKRVRIKG